MSIPDKTPYVVNDPAQPSLVELRLQNLETVMRQQLATLTEISAKFDVLIAHSDEQVSVNRSMASFTRALTGEAQIDDGVVRPGFEDYREGDEGWEVLLKYPNQVADWYPASAQEVQKISELNAKRATRRKR